MINKNSLSPDLVKLKLDRVKGTFVNKAVHFSNSGYPYSLFTLTDYEPPMIPSLVEDMADLIVHFGNFNNVDLIVSEADRGGGPLTHAVSLRTGLPYTLANWYPNDSPGEIEVSASVVFSGIGKIFLNGIKKGQRTIIVDDLLSSGGTALALIQAILKGGASVSQALFVGEKVLMKGRQKLNANYNISIISLVRFYAENGFTKEVIEPI